jgi:hypothetical protein
VRHKLGSCPIHQQFLVIIYTSGASYIANLRKLSNSQQFERLLLLVMKKQDFNGANLDTD